MTSISDVEQILNHEIAAYSDYIESLCGVSFDCRNIWCADICIRSAMPGAGVLESRTKRTGLAHFVRNPDLLSHPLETTLAFSFWKRELSDHDPDKEELIAKKA